MKNKCIDCNATVSKKETKRCKPCFGKYYSLLAKKIKLNVGKKNPNYKDGKTLKKAYCIDCSKELKTYSSKRCGVCHSKYCFTLKIKNGYVYKPKKKCIDCGKELSNKNNKRCMSCRTKHLWKNKKYRLKNSRKRDKNSNWKGGLKDLASSIRDQDRYREWRNSIFKRDNYTCINCGFKGYIEADHIKKFSYILKNFLNKYKELCPVKDKEKLISLAIKYKPFWDINNGRTLCKKCHKKTDTYKTKKGSGKIHGKT